MLREKKNHMVKLVVIYSGSTRLRSCTQMISDLKKKKNPKNTLYIFTYKFHKKKKLMKLKHKFCLKNISF